METVVFPSVVVEKQEISPSMRIVTLLEFTKAESSVDWEDRQIA